MKLVNKQFFKLNHMMFDTNANNCLWLTLFYFILRGVESEYFRLKVFKENILDFLWEYACEKMQRVILQNKSLLLQYMICIV